LLSLFAVTDEEALLHTLTQRRASPRAPKWEGAAGAALLDADARGDAVARDIIANYAGQLASYVMVAIGKVGLGPSFSVVLTGGLLRHETSTLAKRLADSVRRLAPHARVVRSTAPPVMGAVLEAIALSGSEVDNALVATLIGSGLPATLGGSVEPAPGGTSLTPLSPLAEVAKAVSTF
jgi:hypothetical protein